MFPECRRWSEAHKAVSRHDVSRADEYACSNGLRFFPTLGYRPSFEKAITSRFSYWRENDRSVLGEMMVPLHLPEMREIFQLTGTCWKLTIDLLQMTLRPFQASLPVGEAFFRRAPAQSPPRRQRDHHLVLAKWGFSQ